MIPWQISTLITILVSVLVSMFISLGYLFNEVRDEYKCEDYAKIHKVETTWLKGYKICIDKEGKEIEL